MPSCGGQRTTLGVRPQALPTLLLETVACKSSMLARKPQESTLLHFPDTGFISSCTPLLPAILRGAWGLNSGSHVCTVWVLPPSCFPRPSFFGSGTYRQAKELSCLARSFPADLGPQIHMARLWRCRESLPPMCSPCPWLSCFFLDVLSVSDNTHAPWAWHLVTVPLITISIIITFV